MDHLVPDTLHDSKKYYCRRHHVGYHGECPLHVQEELRDVLRDTVGRLERLSRAVFGLADGPSTISHPVQPTLPEEQDRPSSGAGPIVGGAVARDP